MSFVQTTTGSPNRVFGLLVLSLILVCFSSVASAQGGWGAPETNYYIGYYGNANTAGFPDAQLNIVNPGSTGGYTKTDFKAPIGDLCANIYVFTSDQEMVECCSCFVSPNGMIQLSLNLNLTANPLANPAIVPLPVAGALKVVSSSPFANDTCTESLTGGEGTFTLDGAATSYVPLGSLRGAITHVRQTTSTLFTTTETSMHQADLGDGSELSKLQSQCYFLQNTGSGHGRCTCGGAPI